MNDDVAVVDDAEDEGREEEEEEEEDCDCGGGESEPESNDVTESIKSWNICVSMN